MNKILLMLYLTLGFMCLFLVSSTPIFYHVLTEPERQGPTVQRPLHIEQRNFAGEWFGDKGSWILIHSNGSAAFRTPKLGLRKGRVIISEKAVTIETDSRVKTWKIKTVPSIHDGHWRMRLNDETYYRESDFILALMSAGSCSGRLQL